MRVLWPTAGSNFRWLSGSNVSRSLRCTPSHRRCRTLKELEETNDVANIQLEIWEAIANDPDVTEEAASKAEQLQGRLIPISEVSRLKTERQ
jgi:hypothetical protein